MIGSDGNTTIRPFVLNLTKKIRTTAESEELKIMKFIRKIYDDINKKKPVLTNVQTDAGDLLSYHFTSIKDRYISKSMCKTQQAYSSLTGPYN